MLHPETQTNTDGFSPKGNVAALRSVIHNQLDMKTPSGNNNSSRFQKPAPPPVDNTPSWAKNVKVYEPSGYVDPHLNKHNMGRVLDGPVNPNKFFQGVPPPSYSQVKPEQTKPPAPPSKPVSQVQPSPSQSSQPPRPSLDSYRQTVPSKSSYRIPYDASLDPRLHLGEFDIDDSASIISSCISTFGESSEIAGFSAAAEQRHLYEQYRQKLMEAKNDIKEGSETPCVSTSEKVPEDPPAPVVPSIFQTELTPFGHISEKPEKLTFFETPTSMETSGTQRDLATTPLSRSIDLESSQLLVKPKSPAPYSTSSSDHYGTIRRKHKPVSVDLTEQKDVFFGDNFDPMKKSVEMPSLSSPSYRLQNASLNDSLNQAFEISSAIENAKKSYEAPPTPKSMSSNDRSISDTYPVSSPPSSQWQPPNNMNNTSITLSQEKEPEVVVPPSMTSSMSSSVHQLEGTPNVFQPTSNNSSPEGEDMSQWYKKMFKQMHKRNDDVVERQFDDDKRIFKQSNARSQDPIDFTFEDDNRNYQQQHMRQETVDHHRQFEPDNRNFQHQTRPDTVDHRQFEKDNQTFQPQMNEEPVDRQLVDNRKLENSLPPQKPAASDPFVSLFEHDSSSTATSRSRVPPHFHLPSYRFRDEDSRPYRCSVNHSSLTNNKYGTPCMMCDRPRKDMEFHEVDSILNRMNKGNRQRSQNSLEPTGVKQTTNEEELLRVKAEKLAEELRREKDRKHGFVPSATPSLQNNMDRLNSLLYDFSHDSQPSESMEREYPQTVLTATAVYKFEPRSPRELLLNRGDIVRLIRDVDSYWMEGERNGRCGIFPTSYVQINSGSQTDSQKMRAIYPFTARNENELNLKRGEIITRRRQIDSNWLEGSNQIGIIGIFPASYVEPLSSSEVVETVPYHQNQTFPNRPKTPKIEENQFSKQPIQQIQNEPTTYSSNKVRFDLPSSSDSTLQMPKNQNAQSQVPLGMKRIEYESEKQREEPILDQFRKINDDQPMKTIPMNANQPINTMTNPIINNAKKENNILMNAASLIPKGSEMYRAVYPYQPQKDDELQLYTNDIIFVVEKCDDGWFIGTSLRTGEFGIFPGNYVKRH